MDFAERIPAQRGLGSGFHWDAGNNRLPQGKSDLDVSNIRIFPAKTWKGPAEREALIEAN